MLKVKQGTDASETLEGYGAAYAYDENETFHAGGGDDRVNAGSGNDTVYGEEGNDTLYGGNGDDYLDGGAGNDFLNGGYGNDILTGGTGNDRLEGGYGNDTYIFSLGDGKDTVYDYEDSRTGGKEDRIVFGEGIKAEDIHLKREGYNLVIDYSENDRVTVQDAYRYNDDRCFVEHIEFADGSKGTIDYGNTQLDITATPVETEEITESGMTETQPAVTEQAEEQSAGMQTADTSISGTVEIPADDTLDVDNSTDISVSDEAVTETVSVEEGNPDIPAAGQESVQETASAGENAETGTETIVDNCAGILEGLYAADQTPEEIIRTENPAPEQSSAVYDSPADMAVDNIVNLLVQDMSESGTGAVTDSCPLTDLAAANDNVQLWVS